MLNLQRKKTNVKDGLLRRASDGRISSAIDKICDKGLKLNTKKMKIRNIIILLLCAFSSWHLAAQNNPFKDERRIFLFDVTKSMIGYNGAPNIYDEVVKELEASINSVVDERTEIIVIPFQDKVLDVWQAHATLEGKSDIINKIKRCHAVKGDPTNTNIYAPLKLVSDKYISPEKRNILMILTDGRHNMTNPSEADLIGLINQFCLQIMNNDTYAFYVMLTKAAGEDNPFTEAIRKSCFKIIDPGESVNIIDLYPDPVVKFNIKDDAGKKMALNLIKKLGKDLPENLKIKVVSVENGYVSVSSEEVVDEEKAFFTVNFKHDFLQLQNMLPDSANEKVFLRLEVRNDDKSVTVKLLEETVILELINKPERTLIVGKPALSWGTTRYYSDFLWSKYKPAVMEKTVHFDFNEKAVQEVRNVKIGLFRKSENGNYKPVKNDDVILYKNGAPCSENAFFVSGDEESVEIGVEFTKNAQKGAYAWYLKVIDADRLTRINDSEIIEDAQPVLFQMAAKKRNVWNPLLLFLFWLFVVLLAIFLLWMCVLRNKFYPTFRIRYFVVQSPYYASIRLKNRRKLTFTDKPVKQKGVHKVLKGKIAYEINPVWTAPLEIKPRDNKSVRICRTNNYEIEPFTVALQRGEEYTIANKETKEKIKVIIN